MAATKSGSDAQFILLSPVRMFEDVWAGQPYSIHWLPGERAARFPPGSPAAADLLSRLQCSHVGAGAMRRLYLESSDGYANQADRDHDARAVHDLWQRAMKVAHAHTQKKQEDDRDGEEGSREGGIAAFARWARGCRRVPMSVWPPGLDWDLPFTVGGGIVWPSALLPSWPSEAQARLGSLARTLLHELVHVAQFRLLRPDPDRDPNLAEFGRWMQDKIIAAHGFRALAHPRPRICDWLVDYYTLNDDGKELWRRGPPRWWRLAMQNPDTLGRWYGVRLSMGATADRLYLPWLVNVASASRNVQIRTWMLPLAWSQRARRYFIVSPSLEPVDESPEAQGRLARHFGCAQFDHPHELAAHGIVDLLSA